VSDADSYDPKSVQQVMVSSTFTDLKAHRAALIRTIEEHGLHPNVMEHSSARLVDVVDSSLQMVRDSAAYVGVISRKYGQVLEDADRNPDRLSITELEFNEAMRLNRPILLFLMGEAHPVTEKDVELDSDKRAKLDAFRERAKRMKEGSPIERVYAVFESLDDFKAKIGPSLAELRRHLDASAVPGTSASGSGSEPKAEDVKRIPPPPEFYAESRYAGSHTFVGREAELNVLSDWADPADPTNLLLFEAIGGSGKSMLTWEWVTNHAPVLRDDWGGRFWYSFYERGAVMDDFCRHALAYMTGKPLDSFRKLQTPALAERLVAELQARPWLLVLDGLERILVAYHRYDAAQLADEAVNTPTDAVLDHREPTNTIRDEDADLLRLLATANPSKVLVSTRLMPRVLLNASNQPVPGVRREPLAGLRPGDAEALFRAGGVQGDSDRIRAYLRENCDNHPLVIGVLAGLVANYLPARGDFDRWVEDAGPQGGARLNLAKLDLVQKRNHILRAALDDLPEASRRLLSTLALISESVDYETLAALNPHLPEDPAVPVRPTPPEVEFEWEYETWGDREKAEKQRAYEAALREWKSLPEVRKAEGKLAETVSGLEKRGLLQYDGQARRYDLHPVVRGVASGALKEEERDRYGQQVVDHFSSVAHDPYEEARMLEDVAPGLQVVRTLLALGRIEAAADAYQVDLSNTLLFNLEAIVETLALLRPFFPEGWGTLPPGLDDQTAGYIASDAAIALLYTGELDAALATFSAALRADLDAKDRRGTYARLRSIAVNLIAQRRLAASHRLFSLSLDLAAALGNEESEFRSRLDFFYGQALIGESEAAAETWAALDPMGRRWSRSNYRPGVAEYHFAQARFWEGTLEEAHLTEAARLAEEGNNRRTLRDLHWLRGAWRLEQEHWEQAAASFREALRMARERGLPDVSSETGLALAKLHLGALTPDEARQEAERLAAQRDRDYYYLALLWHTLGETEKAKPHALAAYEQAWADGEPYVHRYDLTKAAELLNALGVPLPDLPPYDPASDEQFEWETEVRAAIEQLRAEKAEKEARAPDEA